jgi:hypothetical protein
VKKISDALQGADAEHRAGFYCFTVDRTVQYIKEKALAKNCFRRKLFKISLSFRNFNWQLNRLWQPARYSVTVDSQIKRMAEKCEKSTNQEIQKFPT